MRIDAPEIVALRAKIVAADEEFQLALAFHEAWKPTAYDDALHNRLGLSFASNTFQIIRLALRREMLMALMRLWDSNKDAVGMGSVANTLDDRRVLDALAAEREAQWGDAEFGKGQADALRQRAADATAIIRSYEEGGARHSSFLRFQALRNQRLAHRQVRTSPTEPGGPDDFDAVIQSFYEDMLRLIQLLLLAINGTSYDPAAATIVHSRHAVLFWAGVKGERTEGHPNYEQPAL
jgi:hypothetical protein